MEYKLNEYHNSGLSKEELLEDVKYVAGIIGDKYLSIRLYEKHGKYGGTVFRTHFGSWINVLQLLNLRTNRNNLEMQRISDEDIINDLLSIKNKLNKKTITSSEYTIHGKYSFPTVRLRFGSWSKLLERIGLKQTGFIGKINDEELLVEIERIWVLLGRQPTTTDMKNGISKYDLSTFTRRFGGWRDALKYFLDWINSEKEVIEKVDVENNNSVESVNESIIIEKSIISTRRTPRNINLRLRFKVLLRDNFKCCFCGNSPAKDLSIELHIDHIIPWSKNGETVLNNLQTLCSKCNLGKSNI